MCMKAPKVKTPAQVAPAAPPAAPTQVEDTGEAAQVAGRKAREKAKGQDTVESMFLGERSDSTDSVSGSSSVGRKTAKYKLGV